MNRVPFGFRDISYARYASSPGALRGLIREVAACFPDLDPAVFEGAITHEMEHAAAARALGCTSRFTFTGAPLRDDAWYSVPGSRVHVPQTPQQARFRRHRSRAVMAVGWRSRRGTARACRPAAGRRRRLRGPRRVCAKLPSPARLPRKPCSRPPPCSASAPLDAAEAKAWRDVAGTPVTDPGAP